MGHVSRANPVWAALREVQQSVVMFQGPQSYITPSWYPSKKDHGKVVPTWNYAVAHAHGVARAIHDKRWLHDFLDRLTDTHEASRELPWKMADAPADFIDKLLAAVVGIEIPIEHLVGKLKASQDEETRDRQGTVAGLAGQGLQSAAALASLVDEALAGGSGASAGQLDD